MDHTRSALDNPWFASLQPDSYTVTLERTEIWYIAVYISTVDRNDIVSGGLQPITYLHEVGRFT